MSGCRVFLLSRGLLTPLSPLSVAGFPQGAAQGETLERARASGELLACGVVDASLYAFLLRLFLCLSLVTFVVV